MIDSERWRFCLHESGHGVSAIALGGKCLGLVVFADGSGGLAQNTQLLPDREAYSIASGPAAETLETRFPAPEMAVSACDVTTKNFVSLPIYSSSPGLAVQMARSEDNRGHFDSDDRCLALWAIGGHEDRPESWSGRVAFVKHVAAEIIERNAESIVRVATELFVRGSLCRDEITELLKQEN